MFAKGSEHWLEDIRVILRKNCRSSTFPIYHDVRHFDSLHKIMV